MNVEGDFIMTEDLNIEEDLIVEGNIYGKEGVRYNINAWDITAEDINAGNITARNIYAGNITAWDIYARNIDAGDIDAWNITALDIYARNLEYFAVCFAYNNINCKSIKGRIENCKHFVLDGEITIKKNIPKIIEKDGYKYKLMEKEE